MRKSRIVVAGQIPPPMGGQNAMILGLLEDLRAMPEIAAEHLAFEFTKDTRAARKGGIGKLVELARVIARLVKLRCGGRIDLMVYPPGGPQAVPLMRDVLLLPWVLLLSRRVVLHFHAAGVADALVAGGLLARAAARLYARCPVAVVMTDFNRRDPEACGIREIHVVPHVMADDFRESEIDRGGAEIRVLAMGHLCADKGTPRLIEAMGALKVEYPELVLELAGEPLAPFTVEQLAAAIGAAGLDGRVRTLGVIGGEEKRRAFGRAHLFVFPSTAPYESFGLVLVEALMWALPVVASDWRGNPDVLASAPGTSIYAPADSAAAFTEALRAMLHSRLRWPESGAANRRTFLSRYTATAQKPLPALLLKLATLGYSGDASS